ncbi:MAG TPA: HEAT repeat domain-containing protein, partial [Kofleriaceae bacterium]|nr:HEAT repeat domain-containing protein [Kofleriaceae bacterium]
MDVRTTRGALEAGTLTPDDALPVLVELARGAPTRKQRALAYRLLGDLAGRAFGARWECAERASWALLSLAGIVDSSEERRELCLAMGRGFRNVWLLPYIHRRLSDPDPQIVAAAAAAAGGLGFPALEEAVVELITPDAPIELRLAAIAALGRMGSVGAADRLCPLLLGDPREAAAALTALTEIRSPAGRDSALVVLDQDLEPEVQIAAVRYLAELGALEVTPVLRRLARHDDAEVRIAAGMAALALKAERSRDAAERFLTALGEPDRAGRAVLARRLRTLPVSDVIEQAEILLGEDAAGVVQILGEIRDSEITRYLMNVANRPGMSPAIRARAVGSIEADQAWERGALAELAHRSDVDDAIRAAAVQAMGAFARSSE